VSINIRPERKAADPYFNPANLKLPQDFKQLLRYSRDYYLIDPLVSDIAYKMAEYPITPIIIESPGNDKVKEEYERIFRDMRLKETLVAIGLDYNIYGMSLVTLNVPRKRFFVCKECGEVLTPKGDVRSTLIDLEETVNWRIDGKSLTIHCEKCGQHRPVEIVDEPDKKSCDYTIRRWDPLNIDLEYNPLAETYDYIYNMPAHLVTDIRTKAQFLKETPITFIMAVLNNRNAVRLYRNKVIMLKRPSLASDLSGWGIPPITHILQTMYYLGMLRKANAHIAQDSLVKYRYVSPGTMQMGPYPPNAMPTPNLGVWSGNVEAQIQRWRDSPNDIAIFPVPMNAGSLGGDGRALMVWPEVKNLEDDIIAGMQVPAEFVRGGLTWTGSSVSLRMLENHFINYRDMLEAVLDKLVTMISIVRDMPKPDVRFREFKMADDQMRKQLFMSLNQGRKISDTTMLSEFDLDFDNETMQMIKEAQRRQPLYTEDLLSQRLSEIAAGSKLQSQQAGDILNPESMAMPDFFYKGVLEAGSLEDLLNAPSIIEFMEWLYAQPQDVQQKVMMTMQQQYPIVYGALSGGLQPQAPDNQPVSGNVEQTRQQEEPRNPAGQEPLPESLPPRRAVSPV